MSDKTKKIKLSFYATPENLAWLAAQDAGPTFTINRVLTAHIANEQQHPPLLAILNRIAAAIENGSLAVAPGSSSPPEEEGKPGLLEKLKTLTFE